MYPFHPVTPYWRVHWTVAPTSRAWRNDSVAPAFVNPGKLPSVRPATYRRSGAVARDPPPSHASVPIWRVHNSVPEASYLRMIPLSPPGLGWPGQTPPLEPPMYTPVASAAAFSR